MTSITAIATGASRAATGTITSNTDSTLTLAMESASVLITNISGQTAYIRLNGAVSTTVYDFVLANNSRVWIDGIWISTVHVYVAATSGVRVVYW